MTQPKHAHETDNGRVQVRVDMTGRRFGRLVVIARTDDAVSPSGKHTPRWWCRCDCGQTTVVRGGDLRDGKSRSCGCLLSDTTAARNRKHGQAGRDSQQPLYGVWRTMIQRCTNPKARTYPYYGGRGVTVCERWRGTDGFANFLADMGPRPDGVSPAGRALWSIDRIDNDGPYAPWNCRWADQQTQRANRREAGAA